MRARLAALFLLAALLLGAPGRARADRLVLRSGPPVVGALVSESDAEVVFNPYWSKNPGMTWEVVRVPRSRVKRVEVAPHPEVEFLRRLAAAPRNDAAALVEVAAYAAGVKLRPQARMAYALALAADATNEAALKGIGGSSRWASIRAGNPLLDPALAEALAKYAAESDPKARHALASEIHQLGFDAKPEVLERYRRSALQPKGLQVDRPLAWLSDQLPGAVYTLYVPSRYDPVREWPLLIGLHGGGPDGKLRDEVVGSGDSAMNFYRDLAERRGYIVACPNALRAPWDQPENEKLVQAVIEEVEHLYHVDLDRIYLTGHSMGGFGTWALGPKMAEELAAISPMAGGGRGGIARLVKTKTPIFIYHSADDPVVGVEADRTAAKQLKDTDLDFIYTELPHEKHGFPASVRIELFDFLDTRRLADPKEKDAWPRSSFEGKVTKEEVRYLGDPLAEWEGHEPSLSDLVDALALGGGRAAWAVARLAETKPEGAVAAVEKVLKDRRASADAHAWAAHTLGLLGDPSAEKALRRAVVAEASKDDARLAIESCRALATLGDADASDAVGRAVSTWCTWLGGKATQDEMAFSDWARGVPVLVALVEAWAKLPGHGDVGLLEKTVVKGVLGAGWKVATSERVPQHPNALRALLVRATATAYAAWGADDAARARLKEATGPDPACQHALEEALR